jgi:transcriptional regulator with XRE-family HTH domain
VRLRELRDKTGMTMNELSEKTGTPIRTILNWETAERQPPVDAYPILAKAFGVSVRNLLPKE